MALHKSYDDLEVKSINTSQSCSLLDTRAIIKFIFKQQLDDNK